MTLRAVDVHGFGGGFTLGVVQAGFELTAKMSRYAGFGVHNTLANRHLLGQKWESIASPVAEWERMDAELVFGNPPCSGFSTLSPKAFRGMDSKANDYMWELINFAGVVAPQVVIFESVQQTFRQGLPLMRQLHEKLEELSGKKYDLIHVLHNNASVGGCSTRRRYFWVASQVPFGLERYPLTYIPSFGDVLRDLEPLGLTMTPQPYRGTTCACHPGDGYERPADCDCSERGLVTVLQSSRWAREWCHDGSGMVDGHDISRTPTTTRSLEFLAGTHWAEGENLSTVARRYWETHGKLPKSWDYLTRKIDDTGNTVLLPKVERLVETDFAMGHNQLTRWHANKMARVITGGACHLVLHPHLDRTLTQREAARIQGFPDAWKIWPVRNAPDLGPGWGKGVPVQTGRWVAKWARESLLGSPGELVGVSLADYSKKMAKDLPGYDRERIIDVSADYQPFRLPWDKG